MKVTVTKRYCFKQSYNWYGEGFGTALQAVEEVKAKHPESHIALELNERSSSRVYRVVKYTPVEIELPDMPTEAEFEVPNFPHAKRIKWGAVEKSVDATAKDAWGHSRYMATLTHIPTGTTVQRKLWSENDKYGLGYAKSELEQKADPTYKERYEHYSAKMKEHEAALLIWRQECDAKFKEAQKG